MARTWSLIASQDEFWVPRDGFEILADHNTDGAYTSAAGLLAKVDERPDIKVRVAEMSANWRERALMLLWSQAHQMVDIPELCGTAADGRYAELTDAANLVAAPLAVRLNRLVNDDAGDALHHLASEFARVTADAATAQLTAGRWFVFAAMRGLAVLRHQLSSDCDADRDTARQARDTSTAVALCMSGMELSAAGDAALRLDTR